MYYIDLKIFSGGALSPWLKMPSLVTIFIHFAKNLFWDQFKLNIWWLFSIIQAMYVWIANPCCFPWMWFVNKDSIHISHRKAVAFRSTGHLPCNTHYFSSTSHYPWLQISQHCNELFNLKFPSCKWCKFKLLIKAFVEHFLRYFMENLKAERDPQKWIHLAMAPQSCKAFSSQRAQTPNHR